MCTKHLFRLVLETLGPLPEDRKCFRLINGVLVERTVKEVVPALKTNADGLKKVLEDLVKQYKSREEELEKWKVKSSLQYRVSLDEPLTNPVPFNRRRTTFKLSSLDFHRSVALASS